MFSVDVGAYLQVLTHHQISISEKQVAEWVAGAPTDASSSSMLSYALLWLAVMSRI